MDKIKGWLRTMPLQKAFVSLVLIMAVLVVCISSLTIFLCASIQEQILETVTYVKKAEPAPNEDTYEIIIADSGEIQPGKDGELVMLSTEYRLQNLTDPQRVLYYGSKVSMVLIPTLMFVIGTLFCAWLFYSVKIKQPLELLLQSADRISQNELDFELDYAAADEMGVLCRAMDTMRSALKASYIETWSMMEERRKLSASIAHDLRTPITVMKGYTEYLTHNIPLGRISEQKLLDTLNNLTLATNRLEQYVMQVRDVQALDALPVNYSVCPLRDFFEEQEDEYSLLAQQHKLIFSMNIDSIPEIDVSMDVTIVHRLIENVISNALRFAKSSIVLNTGWSNDMLSICISDDGPGFSEQALHSATEPFYKENTENDHFGLGLSICNTLCQKHHGRLMLNNSDGACITIFIKAKKFEQD